MTKINFELDAEQVDELIKQTLINDYKQLKIENRQILSRGWLHEQPSYIQEDYENNLSYIDGMEAVMKYYIVAEEVDRIIKEEEIKDEFAETADDYDRAHGIHEWDDEQDRLSALEEKVRMLELQITRDLYNKHVDL